MSVSAITRGIARVDARSPTRNRWGSYPRVRRRGALFATVAVAAGVLAALALITPASAKAISLGPLPDIPLPGTGSLGGTLQGVGTGLVRGLLVSIVNSLFSGFESKLTLQVLTWLTSVANQSGGRITVLEGFTSGMSLGLLGVVVTVSVVRYWLAGLSLSGAGGFEALEGLLRSIGAVGFLLIWPFMFGQLVALANICSATILRDPALRSDVAHLINTVVFVTFAPGGAITLFLAIVLAVIGGILFLGLLFLKVLLGAAVTFLYVAMPLACIVWPIEEAAWLARYAMRALLALLVVPVAWALIFATFAAVSVNTLAFQGAHGFVNQLTQPLVAIAMLWLTITIPRTLFKLASGGLGLGRHGGGFLSRAGSYMFARQAGEGLASAGLLPFGYKGFVRPSSGHGGDGPRSRGGGDASGPTGHGGGGGGGVGGGGLRTSPSSSTDVAVGAGAVEAIRAAARKAAASSDPRAERDSRGEDNAALDHDERSTIEQPRPPASASPLPEGRVPAIGVAVGATRPERDHANPVAGLPRSDPGNREVLAQALRQAQGADRPSPGDAHGALRRLGGDVRQRMNETYDHGGAPAVQAEMARLSTSDRISNNQAADFMTLASASGHSPTLTGLLARPEIAQDRAAAGSPSAEPSVMPGARSQPQPTQPYRPSVTERPFDEDAPERSPDVHTRDEAWRRGGPGINPRQE